MECMLPLMWSPYLVEDGLDELRSFPFKEGGEDPCMGHEKPKNVMD